MFGGDPSPPTQPDFAEVERTEGQIVYAQPKSWHIGHMFPAGICLVVLGIPAWKLARYLGGVVGGLPGHVLSILIGAVPPLLVFLILRTQVRLELQARIGSREILLLEHSLVRRTRTVRILASNAKEIRLCESEWSRLRPEKVWRLQVILALGGPVTLDACKDRNLLVPMAQALATTLGCPLTGADAPADSQPAQ